MNIHLLIFVINICYIYFIFFSYLKFFQKLYLDSEDMALFPTVRVPAFEFQFNLAVYPTATTLKTVSSHKFSSYKFLQIVIQGQSHFFVLKDNAVKSKLTGGTHWVEFLPNHVYCFLPSYEGNRGTVQVHASMPDFVKEFLFCMQVLFYCFLLIDIYFCFQNERKAEDVINLLNFYYDNFCL